MSPLGDMQGDLVDMELHRLAVGEGQGQASADATRRADRTEQISALVSLISRLARPRAAPSPLANQTVLLADTRLVLEPDLDGLSTSYRTDMRLERAREVF